MAVSIRRRLNSLFACNEMGIPVDIPLVAMLTEISLRSEQVDYHVNIALPFGLFNR